MVKKHHLFAPRSASGLCAPPEPCRHPSKLTCKTPITAPPQATKSRPISFVFNQFALY